MKKLLLLTLGLSLFAITFFWSACKKTEDPGLNDDEKEAYNQVLNLQDEVSTKLDDWFSNMDSLEAINMAQQEFANDPGVTSATISSQGISVQYANGMRGGIFLDPKDEDLDIKSQLITNPSGNENNRDFKSLVNQRKMILINPHYYERSYLTDQIYDISRSNLQRVGIDLATFYKNTEATVDRFTELSGYGIIQIYSHGLAWPKQENITDIYLLTGETTNDATTKKYWDDLTVGSIPVMNIFNGNNQNKYFISQEFVSKYNDFSNDTVMFFGGFCYSFLGGWPDIIDDFGDGAYLGFDWSVLTFFNANMSVNSMALMSDTSKTSPMNLEAWMNDSGVEKSFWHTLDNRTVNIHYTGDGNLTLWGDVSINLIALSDDGAPVSTPGEAGVAYPFKCEVVSNISELEYVWDVGDGSSPVSASNAVNITWSEDGSYELKVEVKDKSNGNSIGSAMANVTIGTINEVKEFVLSCDHISITLGPPSSVLFSPEWFLNESYALDWDNSSLEWSGLNFSATGTSIANYNYTITGTLSSDGDKISFTAINEKVTDPGIHEEKYTISVSNYPFSHYEHGTPFPDWVQYSVTSDYQNYVSKFEGYYMSNGVTYTILGYNWDLVNEFKVLFSKNN